MTAKDNGMSSDQRQKFYNSLSNPILLKKYVESDTLQTVQACPDFYKNDSQTNKSENFFYKLLLKL